MVEFNGVGGFVECLRSEAGGRIVQPTRGQAVAIANLRYGIPERLPDPLDAVDIIVRFTESEQRQQRTADHHDALGAAIGKKLGDFDQLGPDPVPREERIRHRQWPDFATGSSRSLDPSICQFSEDGATL